MTKEDREGIGIREIRSDRTTCSGRIFIGYSHNLSSRRTRSGEMPVVVAKYLFGAVDLVWPDRRFGAVGSSSWARGAFPGWDESIVMRAGIPASGDL
jgi:hypothetical protein